MRPSASSRIDLRLALLLFLLALFSFVYFKYSVSDVNATSRTALCLAILENRTFRIDRYEHLTIDKSDRDGHYYCDKAPGSSLVAMPFIAVGYGVLRAVNRTDFVSCEIHDGRVEVNDRFKALLILGSVGVSLFAAAAVSSLFLLGRRLGAPRRLAVFCALFLAFGTPFGSWATVLYGHALSASCLLIGLFLGLRAIQAEPTALSRRPSWTATGFLLALAVGTEYPAVVPACLLGILFACMMLRRKRSPHEIVAAVGLLGLGALPLVVTVGWYNTVCFGSPLTTGYQFVSGRFPEMERGLAGITLPNPAVLVATLFSLDHGLLPVVPALIFAPVSAVRQIVRNRYRGLNLVALLIPAYYILLNASYAYWDTGAIPCRHVAAALPFGVVPFLFGWNREARPVRVVMAATFFFSFVYGILLLTAPFSHDFETSYFKSYYLAAELFYGERAKNLLYYAGVSAYISYIPALLVWALLGTAIHRTLRPRR